MPRLRVSQTQAQAAAASDVLPAVTTPPVPQHWTPLQQQQRAECMQAQGAHRALRTGLGPFQRCAWTGHCSRGIVIHEQVSNPLQKERRPDRHSPAAFTQSLPLKPSSLLLRGLTSSSTSVSSIQSCRVSARVFRYHTACEHRSRDAVCTSELCSHRQQSMLHLVIGVFGQQLAAQLDALLISLTSQMILGLPHWIQAC